MVTRPFRPICALLLVWLCALGSGPALRTATQPVAIRNAAELALRDVAEAPLLASRGFVSRTANPRSVDRDAASPLSWFLAPRPVQGPRGQRATRLALEHQAAAHASRPSWRSYDAAAPPVLSRIAR